MRLRSSGRPRPGWRACYLESRDRCYPMRRTREEILDIYRACQAKLGRAPGKEAFCKMSGIKPSEINFYWPRPSPLIKEAGFQPNEFQSKLSDVVVFQDFARVCLHIKKVPTDRELRIAQRELGTKTFTAYKRFGNSSEFLTRFSQWLQTSSPELKPILQFAGWHSPASSDNQDAATSTDRPIFPGVRPFLPASLQYLETLARGERPPFESSDLAVATLFERRAADAFRCMGVRGIFIGSGYRKKARRVGTCSAPTFRDNHRCESSI